jgi:hypothetical protein
MLTNQNGIHDEIKSRLNSGNSYYYSVQKLLSSRLISKNLKIKLYKTVILPVVGGRRWAGHVARMGEVFTGFWLGVPKVRDYWEDLRVGGGITLSWTLGRWGEWIQLAQDRVQWRAFVNTVMNLRVP